MNYYTLIDMDTDGTVKTALFPTEDEVQAMSRGRAYLEEIVPHSFRLHTLRPMEDDADIRCPSCGKRLKLVVSARSPHIRNSIYHCTFCEPPRGGSYLRD